MQNYSVLLQVLQRSTARGNDHRRGARSGSRDLHARRDYALPSSAPGGGAPATWCLAMDTGSTLLAEMLSVLVAAETVALAVEMLVLFLVPAPSEFLSSESESSE